LQQLYLAGAFGNYIRLRSAIRIGLLDVPLELVKSVGNSALLGAKLALFMDDPEGVTAAIRGRTEHYCLSSDPAFQEAFVEEMFFPEQAPAGLEEPS